MEYTFQPLIQFEGHYYEVYGFCAEVLLFRDGKYMGSFQNGDYHDQRSDKLRTSEGKVIDLKTLTGIRYEDYIWDSTITQKMSSTLNALWP